MKFVLAALGLVAGFSAIAKEPYSTWKKYSHAALYAEEDSIAPGAKVTLGFAVTLQPGWHTYWVNPGDSGSPIKLRLTANAAEHNLELLTGPIQFPLPERLSTGPITSFVYSNQVVFMADIVVPDSLAIGSKLALHLDAEWLVCEEVCIPATDSFDLSLPVRAAKDVRPSRQSELFVTWRDRMPRLQNSGVSLQRTSDHVDLRLAIPGDFSKSQYVDFLPLRGSHFGHGIPTILRSSAQQIRLQLENRDVGEFREDLIGLLILRSPSGHLVGLQWGDSSYGFLADDPTAHQTQVAPMASLIWILISAFLGGVILNLMPCVFPILSIKLLSVVKQAGASRTLIRKQNFAYVAGVLLSFLVVGGGLASLRAGGHLIGWGFQLQSPTFVLLLSWLFFLLALQMFGYFEVSWLDPNVGGRLARKAGLTGAFFTGVLAVIVASPCTAPFMGVALGFGISQPIPILLLIFFSIGVGLSLPYLLIALVPDLAKVLPRPGAWMQTIKELFAFPLLLTCVWLVWLLTELKGNLAAGLALTGIVGWFFVIWLWPKQRSLAGLIAIAILGIGLNTLYKLPERIADSVADGAWVRFSESALQRSANEIILVDLTADWCLTCKLNERLVFAQSDVQNFLDSNHVRLVRGDWTKQDPEITKFLNKYRRVGVPFYIAFGPGAKEGRILPEILTPSLFLQEMKAVLQP